MDALYDWLNAHQTLLWILGAVSIVTFVGSLIAVPILVVRMPSDYFLTRERSAESWVGQHPRQARTVVIVKNVFGGLLILAGIAMLVLPGQGVITMLIGISLMNFPGKRRLELRVIRIPAVLAAINWMRAKRGRPPLRLPERIDPP
jgi:hypothetical protein